MQASDVSVIRVDSLLASFVYIWFIVRAMALLSPIW